MGQSDIDQLREEWASLFDRVLAAGEQFGREVVGAEMIKAAQAVAAYQGPGLNSASLSIKAPAKPGGSPRVVRARSGAIQEIVEATLNRSIVPLAALKIVIEAKARDPQTEIKISSVRMALTALKNKGRVIQNNLGEWAIAPRHKTPEHLPALERREPATTFN